MQDKNKTKRPCFPAAEGKSWPFWTEPHFRLFAQRK